MLTQTLGIMWLKSLVAAIFSWMSHVDSKTHHPDGFQLKLRTTEIRNINFILLFQCRTYLIIAFNHKQEIQVKAGNLGVYALFLNRILWKYFNFLLVRLT